MNYDKDKALEWLLRQEFNRLWNSQSLPMAGDSYPYTDKDEYFKEWVEERNFKKYRTSEGSPYNLKRRK